MSQIRLTVLVVLVWLSVVTIVVITSLSWVVQYRAPAGKRYQSNQEWKPVNVDPGKTNHTFRGVSTNRSVRANGKNIPAEKSGNHSNDRRWCRQMVLRGLDHVIIYNAVPKTGSRTISTVARALFNRPSRKGQSVFIPYDLYRDESGLRSFYGKHNKGPKVLRGHSLYTPMDDRRFVYINIIRDPVERYISHLHYSWYGDSNNVDRKNGTKKRDINECVQTGQCLPTGYLPFFCGFHPNCSNSTDIWSLEKAVSNLDRYLVVGLTEEMDDTILVLQKLLPDLFKGVFNEYKRNVKKMKKSYTTLTKQTPSKETVAKLKEAMSQTYEFYDVVERRFHELKECFAIYERFPS